MIYQPMETQTYESVPDYLAKAALRRAALRRPEPKPKVEIKAARIEYVHAFDEHVLEWRRHLARETMTMRDYVRSRCVELGVRYEDIIGRSQFRKHTVPRQMLMWEIKQRRPDMSLPKIGDIMGGRDHTTVLHGIQQHERRLGLSDLPMRERYVKPREEKR